MSRRQPVHLWTIGITGSRAAQPTPAQLRAFREIRSSLPGPVHLLHGDAPGIDLAISTKARESGRVRWLVSPIGPQWQIYGAAAGPLRNAIIVRASDLIATFGGSVGTANCVRQATEYGTPVVDLSGLREVAR